MSDWFDNAWLWIAIVIALLFVPNLVRRGILRLARKDRRERVVWLDRAEAAAGAVQKLFLPGQGTVSVRVPPGVRHGALLRLPEKAAPAAVGEPPGDLFVRAYVRRVPLGVQGMIGLLVVAGSVVTLLVWPDRSPAPSGVASADARTAANSTTATVSTTSPPPVTTSTTPPAPPAVPSTPTPVPRRPTGYLNGSCLTGDIPEIAIPVPANDVFEVDCASPDAHYQVIQVFPGTDDMTRCDANPDTRYSYSETTTMNGVPVNQFVYCMIGLGPYAG